MQYTANKPHNAVLIIQDSGIRYRLNEDHIFKDIRFAQITVIKLKADSNLFPRFFFGYNWYCIQFSHHIFCRLFYYCSVEFSFLDFFGSN